MRLLIVLAASLLAGCAAPEGLGFSGGSDEAREPYFAQHREVVDGEHERRFAFPVEDGAALVNVTIVMDPRTNGLPLPEAAPARLDVAVLSPSGEALNGAILDAQRRSATFAVPAPVAGAHTVAIQGFGAAPEVDGERYGASYVLTIEVVYAG